MAKTISLMARAASMRRRTGWQIHQGAIFSEDMMPSGTAQMTASKVPQIATCRVTIISSTYMRQSVKSGGKKSDIRVRMLPPCSTSAMGFISAPRQAQASMARTRPQMTRRQVSARRSRGGCRAIFISASITMRSLCPVPATCRVRPAYVRSRRSWQPFPWHPYPCCLPAPSWRGTAPAGAAGSAGCCRT